ncbi:SigB/SigF/SigG family RNA polymerase sigma factor [Serpentinicella sp. ANB-PHB4]|uniref:SigB/SigF/SigG family RNA polymerase sigma factor n=1 Tax=Serpentinicella sp. ANB-PHB4 TaxID=3074076 RepID=UPI002861F59E|nr:SigB/SigF/SigG family RNA polymerase sigma factor [Serpentinicella sp. ANB-PHB4]MDR5658922.1 SigB/SigF/SigG family RNA polymerase sigma factor [Serpentinicella sp. ANB-PHB4]
MKGVATEIKYDDKAQIDIKSLSEKDLFEQYQISKDISIRNELINRYIYIAEILSKKYINRGIEYDDIYQVASVGLIYAIQRFDASKGYEFSSFATPTIIGEIKKHFRDKGWSIRVPRRIQELSKKVNIAKNELNQMLQKAPTIKDISEHINCSEEEVIEAMEAGQVYNPKSLDITYDNEGEDKDVQLLDLIGEEDKNYSLLENKDFINNVMDKLNEAEKKVLKERFFDEKTQMEVAKVLEVSQMTVSRMEKKVIEKFKKELKKVLT